MSKSIGVGNILTKTIYGMDATKDPNQQKELEDIIEEFLVAI
jgi:hypothetical protein